MKNTIFTIAALSLMLLAACKKNDTTTVTGNAGGTWTFKSVTYQAPTCDTTSGNVVAMVGGNNPVAEIAVDFDSGVASSPRTFTVIRGNSTLNNQGQVEVGITDANGNIYISTGNSSATVALAITNGKAVLSGTNIELVNLNNPADSSGLTFTIQQTN